MTLPTIGDLSHALHLRRDTVRVRESMNDASRELSTGMKSDIGRAVSGDYGPLIGLDRQLKTLSAYSTAAREATLFTDAAQLALERVQNLSSELAPRLIDSELSGLNLLSQVTAADALSAFRTTIDSLNTQISGRTVFGGSATDRAPLADADTILAELQTAIAAETTADGAAAAIDAWFAPGAGFDTIGYTGSADAMAPFRVADGTEVAMPVKANYGAMRDQIKSLAMAAVMRDGPLASRPTEQVKLARMAGETLLGNQAGLSVARAELGSAQARIDTAATRNSAEKTTLEIARSEIISADPYETAIKLQNLELQLESIYAITARLSRLKLTDFLR